MNKEVFEKLINDIIKDFKLENNITDSLNDDLYNLYCRKAINSILNLTNRIRFPLGLRYIVLDMMNDFYLDNIITKKILNNTDDDSKTSINSISQIEEEGRKVTFNDSDNSTINSILTNDIQNKLDSRMKEIYRYKLLYKEMLSNEED